VLAVAIACAALIVAAGGSQRALTAGPDRPAAAATAVTAAHLAPATPASPSPSPLPAPVTGTGGCGFLDFTCEVSSSITSWFAGLVKSAVNPLLTLIGQSALSTPQPGSIPAVQTMWATSRIAIRYARATRDRAAGVLLGDMSQDLAEVSRLVRNQRADSTVRRLTRVSAQMSGLMCLVFCLLDDRRSFRKWARTASLAGNEAGDPETLSWVLAQEAYGHYYSGDVAEALDVARHAYEVVRVPCTGAALASALEARAYAVTGRGAETRDALARAEDVLSQLDGDSLIPSAFGYNEASFRFHEGNAYTHLGDFKSAMRAQDRALELCAPDNYADWAMTRLDRAQCLIYAGDVTSGLDYAKETVTTITAAQRQGIITLRGREIMKVLPENEKKRAAARSFEELLVASARNSEDASA
jgi:tetratricopeptide (TPR) repeat protein